MPETTVTSENIFQTTKPDSTRRNWWTSWGIGSHIVKAIPTYPADREPQPLDMEKKLLT